MHEGPAKGLTEVTRVLFIPRLQPIRLQCVLSHVELSSGLGGDEASEAAFFCRSE